MATSTKIVAVTPVTPETLKALALEGPIAKGTKISFGGQRYRPVEGRGLITLVAI